MKKIKYLVIVISSQLISWIIFTLLDYLTEIFHGSLDEIIIFISIILPIVISIIYLINEKRICELIETTKLKSNIITSIIWIIETSIVGSYICNKVNYNKWIINQYTNELFDMNGFEYFIFAFGLAIIPIIINVVYQLVKFVRRKIKT